MATISFTTAGSPVGSSLPVLTVRVDWGNDGSFSDPFDLGTGRVLDSPGCTWTRGRSADFSAEATGSAQFTLDNFDDFYTPDRNWHDNPSFESAGTTGWVTTAIASLTAAATSITQVADTGAGAGVKAGEAVLTATLNSGVNYPIPYLFRAGIPYSATVYLRSMSGTLNIRAGLASSGTPADFDDIGVDITTAWAPYTIYWVPTADRSDVVFYVRTNSAAAATVRIDAIGVNPGAVTNAYIEAPTKGQLVPGRPVQIYATYQSVNYPQFFGYIERLTPNYADRTVSIVCYDVLRRLQETDVVVAANAFVQRSARDFRREVLEDYERGNRNLIANPSFETNTTGWTVSTGTITRITTDNAPGAGAACGSFAWTSGTATLDNLIRLAPVFFIGQVYRFSVYLKVTSGTLAATIGIGEDSGISVFTSKAVTATTTWQRFTLTYTAANTRSANSNLSLRPFITITSGTLLVDAASFTRGQALQPYADAGTGRWPNWCGNGSFDGGALNGWYDGWTNLIANPSFETNTTGWSVAGDAFVGAATSITRVVGTPQYGTARADVAGAGNSGAFVAIPGTFKLGVTYNAFIYARVSAGSGSFRLGIGSQGTPADKAETASVTTNTAYQKVNIAWTPTADRTDAHFYVKLMDGSTTMIDGAAVFRRDPASSVDPGYADVGPGTIGSFTSNRVTSATAKYGSKSQSFDTPATIGAGRVYDFNHYGPYFAAQAFTASVWINPSSAMPYKVGFAANKGDGTFDEPTAATGTAAANVWTQVTVTWTPTADRTTATAFDVVLYVYQTDATARTVLLDGVRVIPGSSADSFEMSQWSLDTESDQYLTTASLAGSALAALNTINGYALTRHYIKPTLASPYYQYVSSSRTSLAAKTVAETFNDDLADMTVADIDRTSIINVVPVAYAAGTEYYSDETSVSKYGARPSAVVGSAAFNIDRTIPDAVGPALVTRYKDPRARPAIKTENRWPSQLQRELDDLVTVNFGRLRIANGRFLVLLITTTVDGSAQHWTQVMQLEDHAF